MAKNFPTLHEYLEPYRGSDHKTIQDAKNEYKRKYQAHYKNKQRKSRKEIRVPFSFEDFDIVAEAAKNHNLSPTRFICKATLAYINQEYLSPHEDAIAQMEATLSHCLGEIHKLADQHKSSERMKYLHFVRSIHRMEENY